MKNTTIGFIAALVFLAVVCSNIILWITISLEPATSFAQAKVEYLLRFPAFLRNARLITVLNIVLLSIAAILFFKIKGGRTLKTLSFILFIFSVVLIAWQLFSLM